MGATRLRVTRQLLTESLLLSVVGAVLGLLLGAFLIQVAKATVPSLDFTLTLDFAWIGASCHFLWSPWHC